MRKEYVSFFNMRWFLISIGALYVVAYFALPATPGNAPFAHPLGWWGWFDQGQYLQSSNAFIRHEFSPDMHFYPPLYPAAGALFLKWSDGHPYFILNLFCLLWFAYVFIRVADRYIPRWAGVLIFFGTTIINLRVFENYLIPWTTTLSVALFSSGVLGLVWLQDVIDRKGIKIEGRQVFFVAVCLGLLLPTRPGDAASIGGVLGLALLFGYGYARRVAVTDVPPMARFMSLAIIGTAIGPAIYFGFNLAVFGTLSGGYMQAATGNGFYWMDLPEKFVSLWLDSEALYSEADTSLTQRHPWLFLSLAGLAWVLIRGDLLLRTLAIAISTLFIIYLPYSDLLPNGLWRYMNIHYFKWTFPFFALFAWLLAKEALSGWQRGEGWVPPSMLFVAIPMLLLSLHFTISTKPLELIGGADGYIRIGLDNNEIDLIDLKGLSGGFTEIYFGEHHLLLDGHEMKRVRDYRLLPLGYNTRLIFIRPVYGKRLEFLPDHRLARHDALMVAQSGTYHFALGLPKPFRHNSVPQLFSGYRLGDVIDFSRQGHGQFYAEDGWSDPEDWGRWSVNKEARISMRLSNVSEQPLTLELTYGAFIHPNQPCQRVVITANGRQIITQAICITTDGGIPRPFRYALPAGVVPEDGLLTIRIGTPDAVSPRSLGFNDDPRVLGVGLKTLRVIE